MSPTHLTLALSYPVESGSLHKKENVSTYELIIIEKSNKFCHE